MHHTVTAVYTDRAQAERAMEDLLGCGFAPVNVRLSDLAPHSRGNMAHEQETLRSGARHFVAQLMGRENRHARLYEEAIAHGHSILAVRVSSDHQIDNAVAIMEKYRPGDIDEDCQTWQGKWEAELVQPAQPAQPGTLAPPPSAPQP
ncbi:MAG TPA: hypothetical protein VIT92_00255 [Burkholderiaceae bacterium]